MNNLKRKVGRRYSTTKMDFFLGLFFPLFHLLLHSTPGSHTREESKIALLTNAKKNE